MKRRRRSIHRKPAGDVPSDKKTNWLEEGEEGETPEIGKDLLFEILARLSIECLIRLKVVSKYFYRLISSTEFIKFHLQYACDDSQYANHKLVKIEKDFSIYSVRVWQTPLLPVLCDPNIFRDTREVRSDPLEFWEEESQSSTLTFVGSCSGLICIAGFNNRVIVWNPALGKCKRLPYFGRGSKVAYGFGYDESSDDFKVVGIRNTPKTLIKMYSARANSWKKLQEDGFESCRVNGHGCFLNGKLHWATESKRIMTIDLSSEALAFMEPPDDLHMLQCSYWTIHAVGEFLAVFGFYVARSKGWVREVDLFMMARYGEKESWARVNKVSPERTWDIVCPGHGMLSFPMYVPPSKQGEAWRMIPIPSHMTSNAIHAFLLYSAKCVGYPVFNRGEFARQFEPSLQHSTVYVESLAWPFLSDSKA